MKELKKEILEETENDYEIPDLKEGLINTLDSDDYIGWFSSMLRGEPYDKSKQKVHCVTRINKGGENERN